MEQIRVKAKRWGNSYGVILPKSVVEKESIRPGTDLVISLRTKKAMTVGDLMALSRKHNWSKFLKTMDTQKAMREVDTAFEPE